MKKIKPEAFWENYTSGSDYKCKLCNDSGWRLTEKGAIICNCRADSLLARRRHKAGLTPALINKRFENFNLDYYPEFLKITEDGKEATIHARAMAISALEAAQNFIKCILQKKSCRGLIFEGEVGRGKTFLAAAITNTLIENYIDAFFLVVPEFLDELRFSYQNESSLNEADLIKRAGNAGVLILDDLGSHNYSDWTKSKIFSLLNYRLNHSLPCIITTNLSVDQMNEAIGSRSVSRIMEMCDYHFLFSPGDIRHSRQEGGSA